ncbi:hypothetical protein AVEN_10228-1 [Araneus ventricosus]|uniref:HAT C-terminal dimerisation domain-containing protein n=1 Tax=Araneus ventricosus TaxID=182803 RepID=A0A4Y2J1W4_ARAVE|nr:hypothetical protein AVEN_10228-1 [Araneus ventricosus]
MYPSAFQTFKPNTRLDIFFNEYMSKSVKDYNKIWPDMKIIFTLSHGQASIERGFSTNKKIEVENMAQESYVARRIVCDAIKSYGEILNIPISNDLQKFVFSARQKYMLHLEENKKRKINEGISNKGKIISDEMDYLKVKRQCLETDVSSMDKTYENLTEEAE